MCQDLQACLDLRCGCTSLFRLVRWWLPSLAEWHVQSMSVAEQGAAEGQVLGLQSISQRAGSKPAVQGAYLRGACPAAVSQCLMASATHSQLPGVLGRVHDSVWPVFAARGTLHQRGGVQRHAGPSPRLPAEQGHSHKHARMQAQLVIILAVLCRQKWLFRPQQSPESQALRPEARCISEVVPSIMEEGPQPEAASYSWAMVNGVVSVWQDEARSKRLFAPPGTSFDFFSDMHWCALAGTGSHASSTQPIPAPRSRHESANCAASPCAPASSDCPAWSCPAAHGCRSRCCCFAAQQISLQQRLCSVWHRFGPASAARLLALLSSPQGPACTSGLC